MARTTAGRPEIAQHQLFLEWVAKNLNLFGEHGLPWGTTFEELETLAASLGNNSPAKSSTRR